MVMAINGNVCDHTAHFRIQMGTLADMLRKSPDTGISLHGGPFPPEGNLVCGSGGLVYRGL
jgi:hypothetical protein